MKKKKHVISLLIIAILISVIIGGCSSEPSKASNSPESVNTASTVTESKESTKAETSVSENSKTAESQLLFEKFTSKAISVNLLDEAIEQDISVYLPPSYASGNKSYPVVYYLHGFGEPVGSFIASSKSDLDKAFANGAKEFILVGMNGQNKSGGSFYVNSPVIGNWEDYVVNEVVTYIDSKFRTIKESSSRGICGHSMGGFGTINLALKHPDIFGSMYAVAPGIAANDDFDEVLGSWEYDQQVLDAYGQAFCPNLKGQSPFCKIPSFDGTKSKEQDEILKQWIDGYANLDKKLKAYISKNKSLRGFGLSYGTMDSYSWIPKGTEYFIKLLKNNKIEPTVFIYEGGHEMPMEMVSEHIIPFFEKNLVWNE